MYYLVNHSHLHHLSQGIWSAEAMLRQGIWSAKAMLRQENVLERPYAILSCYLTDYHDAFSPCNLFQFFQPKPSDLMKKLVFVLSHVTSVKKI
jgi:hypothetical protein